MPSGSPPWLEGRLYLIRHRADVRRYLVARLEISLGAGDQRGIAERVDREARHDLGGIDHALLGLAGFTLRGDLPGVAGCPDRNGRATRLNGRNNPAHVAD